MPLDPSIIGRLQPVNPIGSYMQGQKAAQQNRMGELQIQGAENKLAAAQEPTAWNKDQIGFVGNIMNNLVSGASSDPNYDWDANSANAINVIKQAGIDASGMEGSLTRENAQLFLQNTAGGDGKVKFQAVPTQQGMMRFNKVTGKPEIMQSEEGGTYMPPQYDPVTQGKLAGAKTRGSLEAKTSTQAQLDLPSSIASGEESIRLLDEVLAHPGMRQAVGASRGVGMQLIPGTDAYDFSVRLDQIKGKQFMEAYKGLRGGGQITEVEGKKAEEAIARMNASQSEEAFIQSVNDFKSAISAGIERARQEAGQQAPQLAIGTRKGGYVYAGGDPANKASWKKQ